MLEQIRTVLVNTSHPGNIGSCARAMKTMGLQELYLAAPLDYPHPKAFEMASGASDVLENAIVVDTLEEALAGCHLVIGSSTRIRRIPWPLCTPRELAEKIKLMPVQNKTAILFGREQSGLSNQELERCHWHVQIPANPQYSSLNIAAALQVIAYELRVASFDTSHQKEQWDHPLATTDEMEKFFDHLQSVLLEINFLKASAPRKLMTRLRRLFFRARPDMLEMNILRGFLSAIQNKSRPL